MDKGKNKRFLDLSSSQRTKRLRVARRQNNQIGNSSNLDDTSSTTDEEVLVENNEREILQPNVAEVNAEDNELHPDVDEERLDPDYVNSDEEIEFSDSEASDEEYINSDQENGDGERFADRLENNIEANINRAISSDDDDPEINLPINVVDAKKEH